MGEREREGGRERESEREGGREGGGERERERERERKSKKEKKRWKKCFTSFICTIMVNHLQAVYKRIDKFIHKSWTMFGDTKMILV